MFLNAMPRGLTAVFIYVPNLSLLHLPMVEHFQSSMILDRTENRWISHKFYLENKTIATCNMLNVGKTSRALKKRFAERYRRIKKPKNDTFI